MKKPRRQRPEDALQIAVRRMLMARCPSLFWIGGAAGQRMSWGAINKAKAMGQLQRGWPDISALCPDGLIRTIELKAPKGTLSKEQKDFRDQCATDNWFLCRSVAEVESALTRWGIPLREAVELSGDEPDFQAWVREVE